MLVKQPLAVEMRRTAANIASARATHSSYHSAGRMPLPAGGRREPRAGRAGAALEGVGRDALGAEEGGDRLDRLRELLGVDARAAEEEVDRRVAVLDPGVDGDV